MTDVFVSYARTDEPHAQRVTEALRADGFRVWRDEDLPAHRPYAEVIEERLVSAKAVVVIWSAESAKSQWVRAEADTARAAGTLVQVTLDGCIPPLPFNQIHCADLSSWDGTSPVPGWRKLKDSVTALAGAPVSATKAEKRPGMQQTSICVLPFQNMPPTRLASSACRTRRKSSRRIALLKGCTITPTRSATAVSRSSSPGPAAPRIFPA